MSSRFLASLYSTLFATILAWPSGAVAGSFAYVSLDGENKIVVHAVNGSDGTLSRTSETELEGSAGPLCVSPDRRFLFASVRSAGKLAAFRISPDDGNLTHINTVTAGINPAYVATDRTGRHLLTAYYTEGKITSHAIDKNGRISAKATQELPTADKAHAIMTDRDNRFVYVPHTGPNTIFQFRFDEKSGRFTALKPARVNTGEHTGPRQFALHPKLDVAYFDYEQGSAIAAFDVDRKSGRLMFRERLSTLPKSYLVKTRMRGLISHRMADFYTWPIAGTTVWPGLLLIQKQVRSRESGSSPPRPCRAVSTSTRPGVSFTPPAKPRVNWRHSRSIRIPGHSIGSPPMMWASGRGGCWW